VIRTTLNNQPHSQPYDKSLTFFHEDDIRLLSVLFIKSVLLIRTLKVGGPRSYNSLTEQHFQSQDKTCKCSRLNICHRLIVHAPAKYNDYKNDFIHNSHVTLKSDEVN